jgi:hypothetical protein
MRLSCREHLCPPLGRGSHRFRLLFANGPHDPRVNLFPRKFDAFEVCTRRLNVVRLALFAVLLPSHFHNLTPLGFDFRQRSQDRSVPKTRQDHVDNHSFAVLKV